MSFRESSPQQLAEIERKAYDFMRKNLRGVGKEKAEKRISYARLHLLPKMFATVYSLPRFQARERGIERAVTEYRARDQVRTKVPSPTTLQKIESLMPERLTDKQLVKRLAQLRATKRSWVSDKLSNAYYRRVVDPGGVTGKVPKDVFLFTNLDPTIRDFETEIRKRRKPQPIIHKARAKPRKKKAVKIVSLPDYIWKVRKR